MLGYSNPNGAISDYIDADDKHNSKTLLCLYILCCFPLNNCYKFMGFHPKSVRDFEEGI